MKIISESDVLRDFLDDKKFISGKSVDERQVNSHMNIKLNKMFVEKPNAFVENSRVYDEYFLKMFVKWKSATNIDDFNTVIRALDKNCQSQSKLYSALKHAAFTLSDLLGKAAQQVALITTLYSNVLKEQENFSKETFFASNNDVEEVNRKLKLGLSEWSAQLTTQKNFVVEHLSNFFHFKKHEYLSVSELVNYNFEVQDTFRRNYQALEEKKQKLFDSRNVEKWQVDTALMKEDFNTVFKDFEKVKPYMLPSETTPLMRQKELLLFMNKHILFEFINFYLNSQFYLEENFANFTAKMLQSFQKKDVLWNLFKNPNVNVSAIDRESTVTIKSRL